MVKKELRLGIKYLEKQRAKTKANLDELYPGGTDEGMLFNRLVEETTMHDVFRGIVSTLLKHQEIYAPGDAPEEMVDEDWWICSKDD